MEEGQWLGGYHLVRRLGVGGTGTVWLARDEGGMRVALKLLHPAVAANESSRQRLIRETRTVNSVHCDGVAHVVDVEIDDVQPFIVSEFVDGPTLAELLKDRPLSIDDAIECAQQLYDIISAVHDAGVIHRDIKPGNIIMSDSGPVLIDFGIAQAHEDVTLTAQGFVSATASYASPELLRGQRADESSDWWAWAATVLHIFSGRLPFGAGSTEAVMNRVLQGQPDTTGVPVAIAQILRGALAVNPAERFHADDVLSLLAVAQASQPWDDEDATTVLPSHETLEHTRILDTSAPPEATAPYLEPAPALIPPVPTPTSALIPSASTLAPALIPSASTPASALIPPVPTPAPALIPPAPTPTPFVVVALTTAAALLPLFLGAPGILTALTAMLTLALIGATNRAVRHRRINAASTRPTDWWVALARLPLTLISTTLKMAAGCAMGLVISTVTATGIIYGAPQIATGRLYINYTDVPRVLYHAQTRPAIADITSDPYAATVIYALIALTFLIAALFPTGADLREGIALPARALLAPWWARTIFVLIIITATALTWMLTVKALVFSM